MNFVKCVIYFKGNIMERISFGWDVRDVRRMLIITFFNGYVGFIGEFGLWKFVESYI